MAEKQTILGRIAQLAKANINSLLDRAEDPEKMIDQLIRDFDNNIAEAKQAIAQTIGNLRLAEQDNNEDVAAVAEWGQKAQIAITRAQDARTAGNEAEAARLENLAKQALQRQLNFENEVKANAPILASQNEVAEKLKTGLQQMETKRSELVNKRNELVARAKTAQAQVQVQQAVSSINVLDPSSELSRFEERVRQQEAQAIGQAEVAAASLDLQFSELESSADSIELDARFEQLRQQALGSAPAPAQITDGDVADAQVEDENL